MTILIYRVFVFERSQKFESNVVQHGLEHGSALSSMHERGSTLRKRCSDQIRFINDHEKLWTPFLTKSVLGREGTTGYVNTSTRDSKVRLYICNIFRITTHSD